MSDKKKVLDADTYADICIEKQMELKEKSRFANILTTVLCLGFIFAFAIGFWIAPDAEYSEAENRSLAQRPEFTVENLISGQFTADFADYMADQFPLRDVFVGIKAASETLQLKGQNNNTIIADDGYLVARSDYPSESVLNANLSSAAKFQAACDEKGINCIGAFAPRKIDACEELVPSVYGSHYSDRIWNILDETSEKYSLEYINLRDYLRGLDTNGLYYKSDHHWTSKGAYEAYAHIIESFGETAYSADDFEIETVTDSFYGTTWSAAGVKWAPADTIEYYRYEGDGDFTMRILDKSNTFEGYDGCTYETDEDGNTYATFSGFYVKEFLEKKDKYASFIGGNFGYTEITLDGEDRETMLIVKDSFSHSMVPFLARHYNLVLVDLRYYSQSMIELCEARGIENVLMLYNMETLCEANYLKWLTRGIK